MYRNCIKRLLDFVLSLSALLVLWPLLLLLTVVGAVAMKGNPFFTQERPGKNEKIFKLVKFRTMTMARDEQGNLLPDKDRLNKYGKFLRDTSMDELPELFNILKGDMSFVGPRPLLVEYLPLYNAEQHRRHELRPGLTGLAQINGRNIITWEAKFKHDIEYVEKISLRLDVAIFIRTFSKVIQREGINYSAEVSMQKFTGSAK